MTKWWRWWIDSTRPKFSLSISITIDSSRFLFDHRRRDRQALSFSSLSRALAVQVSSVTEVKEFEALVERCGEEKESSWARCHFASVGERDGLPLLASAATLRSRTRKITTDVKWLRETENYAWRKDATGRVARLPCCHLLTAHLTEEQQSIASRDIIYSRLQLRLFFRARAGPSAPCCVVGSRAWESLRFQHSRGSGGGHEIMRMRPPCFTSQAQGQR